MSEKAANKVINEVINEAHFNSPRSFMEQINSLPSDPSDYDKDIHTTNVASEIKAGRAEYLPVKKMKKIPDEFSE